MKVLKLNEVEVFCASIIQETFNTYFILLIIYLYIFIVFFYI